MTTLEQVIATVRTLPPADRQQLQLVLQAGLPEQADRDETAAPINGASQAETASPPPARGAHPGETLEQQLARFRKAQDWIREHRAEYLGQWVVLVGDQLISHSFDSRVVDQEAKAAGIEVPFMALVVEEPEAWMGML